MIKYELNNDVRRCLEKQSSPTTINNELKKYHKCNFYSFLIVFISALGTAAVGNFRVSESALLHFTSAATCFFPMVFYYGIHIYIALLLSKHKIEAQPTTMAIFAVIGIFSLFCFCAFSIASIWIVGLNNFLDDNWRFNWGSANDGYTFHCLGTVFEWIAINTLTPVFFGFFNRMRKFQHFDEA